MEYISQLWAEGPQHLDTKNGATITYDSSSGYWYEEYDTRGCCQRGIVRRIFIPYDKVIAVEYLPSGDADFLQPRRGPRGG